ncbi:MAG: hypothetical protein P8Y70_00085 [Candidatus Lokiarchaeota archaeon]
MAISNFNGRIKVSIRLHGIEKLQAKSPEAFRKAQTKAAIQFLNWCNNGSDKESAKPPIRWGVLRGSSSGFVGNNFVQSYPQSIKPGADERPTPANSYNGKDKVITVCWNTEYATKMHETRYNLGKYSAQDGNAGPKWLEKHLKRDREDLMKMIGMEFKKETGL